MRVVNIRSFENSIVLHFDTEDTRINAYTLASTLVALADAAKAVNASINPGCDVEIVVEALGPGSFRALIRAIYTSSKNLFANQVVAALVLGVLGNYIYDRTLKADENLTVEVKTDLISNEAQPPTGPPLRQVPPRLFGRVYYGKTHGFEGLDAAPRVAKGRS